MSNSREIVITGMGVVSPIGIGTEAYWDSLAAGRSGIRSLDVFAGSDLPTPIGGEISDFDPKQYIRPRKSLKVMSRDIQLAFVAVDQACEQANFTNRPVDPERLGVVYGADMIAGDPREMIHAIQGCMVDGQFDFSKWGHQAMAEMYPLWMLKYLPNMPACHVGIAHDARGPNNSLTLRETSSLSAVSEAVRVIERGQADAMIVGGTGCWVHPCIWAYNRSFELSGRLDDPAAACRPFDADRDGMVHGEGSSAFIMEERKLAESRGADILARVIGFAATFEPHSTDRAALGDGIRNAIRLALQNAGIGPNEVGHVNADGAGTVQGDAVEAQAIRDMLGDVPVTAPKSFFGNLGAGTGAVEMVASVLALGKGRVPFTLNYETPDPLCPINVVSQTLLEGREPTALLLNQTNRGQAVAVVLAAP